MGQWDKFIEPDDGRLPQGMRRIGYDTDSQCYYYRDADNSVWRGEPGSQFGTLKLVSRPRSKTTSSAPQHGKTDAFPNLEDRKDQMFAKDLVHSDHELDAAAPSPPPPPYNPSSRQFTDFNQLLSKKKHRKSESISHSMIQAQPSEQSVLSKMKRSLSVKQAAAFVRQRSGTL